MPFIVDKRESTDSYSELSGVDYGYEYPDGIDLRPSSPIHRRIVEEVMSRARESHAYLSSRHEQWGKVDEMMTAYIPLDKEEERLREADPRKPVAIVLPLSYAMKQTTLAYLSAAFMADNPIFQFNPRGPEDFLNVALLELLIDWQMQQTGGDIALHTQWSDMIAYGFGVVSPRWKVESGFQTITRPPTMSEHIASLFGRGPVVDGFVKDRKRVKTFEGNELQSIDPYMYLPDPNVPIHEPHKGEFVGWIEQTNLVNMRSEEADDDDVFNVEYLNHTTRRSILYSPQSPHGNKAGEWIMHSDTTKPVDNIWMYMKIIPREYKLGESSRPETWLFRVSGDTVLTYARPMGLNHDRFPVAACAADTDGRTAAPISRVEMIYPLQVFMNWAFNAHVANIRKAINDMLLVDPSLVNMEDIMNPKPGKVIKLRRSAWGRGVEHAVQQLAVHDVTRNHVNDVREAIEIAQRVMGTPDLLQGIMEQRSEAMTATQSRGMSSGATSRMQHTAFLIGRQSMRPLAYMLASQTQQLQSMEIYLRVTGRWEAQLRDEYGVFEPTLLVSPMDIIAEFDVEPRDGSVPSPDNAVIWKMMFDTVTQNPNLMATYDDVRIFKHWARMTGARNINEFIRKAPLIQPTILPDEQVQEMAGAGNLAPMEGAVA